MVGDEVHIHPTTLSLEAGGFNVLLGTTLSGKTTLLRLMAGLETPSKGEVWFEGENVTGVAVQKRSVSMVYQQFINYPNFTVFDNIASPLRVMKTPKDELDERVNTIAKMLKLDRFLSRLPAELSGGQQQRTALARALIKNSKLVLLDEPLANLDYKLREELRDEMPRLFADTGATVVYSTTEPMEALILGGHTATLHEGSVTQYRRTIEGYRLPDNLISARVFSDPPINVARVERRDDYLFLNDSVYWPVPDKLKSRGEQAYLVAIRPHHLTLEAGKNANIPVDGIVKVAELSGSDSVIHIDVDGRNWVSEVHGIHGFNNRDAIRIYMQIDKCLYFSDDQHHASRIEV